MITVISCYLTTVPLWRPKAILYRGEEGETIPREATHITVGEGVTFVRAHAFCDHPNIVEVICHDKVEKIERGAFILCPSLRRVIMPGVKEVEKMAFWGCLALADVECGKLEIVGEWAFGGGCILLKSINLPSARIVEKYAFAECGLLNVKYGNKLERFRIVHSVTTILWIESPSH